MFGLMFQTHREKWETDLFSFVLVYIHSTKRPEIIFIHVLVEVKFQKVKSKSVTKASRPHLCLMDLIIQNSIQVFHIKPMSVTGQL